MGGMALKKCCGRTTNVSSTGQRAALMATGLFSDVQPTFRGSQLIITVNENQVISRVVFRYGMNGVDLVTRLRALGSPPRALLITTYQTDRLRKIPGFPPPGVTVLRKPIDKGRHVAGLRRVWRPADTGARFISVVFPC